MSPPNRLFVLNLSINLTAEEGVLLLDYLKNVEGIKGEIGHVLSKKAQETVDDLVAKATIYQDKKG